MTIEERIAILAAKEFAGKNWHHDLSANATKIVDLLCEGGYITPNKPANGFVGRINPEKVAA